MSQTAYAINIPAATYPGQIADASPFRDFLSAKAVAAAVSYGLLMVVDASNTSDFGNLACKVPAAAADITTAGLQLGVSVADQARAQNPAVNTAQYPQYSAVSCGKAGRYWVVSEGAVTDGGKVYVRWQTGDGGTVHGSFSNTLDTSVVGNALLANAVWRGTTAAAGFAVVELNLS